jgi:hypothetical protein
MLQRRRIPKHRMRLSRACLAVREIHGVVAVKEGFNKVGHQAVVGFFLGLFRPDNLNRIFVLLELASTGIANRYFILSPGLQLLISNLLARDMASFFGLGTNSDIDLCLLLGRGRFLFVYLFL